LLLRSGNLWPIERTPAVTLLEDLADRLKVEQGVLELKAGDHSVAIVSSPYARLAGLNVRQAATTFVPTRLRWISVLRMALRRF
jgi:hypothetical protein